MTFRVSGVTFSEGWGWRNYSFLTFSFMTLSCLCINLMVSFESRSFSESWRAMLAMTLLPKVGILE